MQQDDRMLCKTHRVRVAVLIAITLATYGAIAFKLYWIQIVRHDYYANRAEYQQHRTVTLDSQRGEIVDRNGRLLAGSHESDTIILDTRKKVVLNTAKLAGKPGDALIARLAKLSKRSEDTIASYFNQGREYVLDLAADEDELKAYQEIKYDLDLPSGLITFDPKSFAELVAGDAVGRNQDPFEALVKRLASAMGLPEAKIRDCFEHPKRHVVYRKAPDDVAQTVNVVQWQLGLPDSLVDFDETSKRDYPNGELASHIIGFTKTDDKGSDNIGLAGLELTYNAPLSGETRKVRLLASGGLRRSALDAISDEAIESTFGNTLVLTIDQRIQSMTETALNRAVAQYQALSGGAVVMDVKTGEILALANCPDFDLNDVHELKGDDERKRNRVLTDPREVGSVMKIITSSLLIDSGLLSPDEMINCHDGSAWVGGRVIRDDHPMGVVPFSEAFAESSNIAMASLADARLEPNAYYAGLQRFGVGKPTGIDLPGENGGILRPVARWTGMSKASLAIGYETSLTPMQVVAALGAIGNDGVRMKPHVALEIRDVKGETIRKFDPESLGRVVGPETCKTLRGLMEGVVLHGTASREGKVPGYRVGGKTGTTVKLQLDKDGHKSYVASFAGLAPIDAPKLAIYVYVDAPRGAKYGGDVAAPVFREIAWQALTYLQVPPTDKPAYDAYKIARAPYGPTPAANATLAAAAGDGGVPDGMQIDVDESAAGAVDLAEANPLPRPALPGMDPPAAPATGPRMPDCRGMTILEAIDALAKAGIQADQADVIGSGVAASQEPAAGARLAQGQTAKVIFTHIAETRVAQKSSGAPVTLKLR